MADLKKVISFRFDPALIKWLEGYTKEVGATRTAVVDALLVALREARLWVEPDTRPNPFPGVTRPEILPVKPFEGIRPGTYPHRYRDREPAEPAVPPEEWAATKEDTHAS